ncbi:hypothetical protein Hanom_Chr08g00723701 [Helianthus anomalus]
MLMVFPITIIPPPLISPSVLNLLPIEHTLHTPYTLLYTQNQHQELKNHNK